MSLISLVIPVYNEGENLTSFAGQAIETCKKNGWKVVFVNDGSTDNTKQILKSLEDSPDVKVIQHKVNRGYGGALTSGIRQVDTPFLVTIDGDGQHSLDDVDKVFRFALKNDADMVIGKRESKFSSRVYRKLGKTIIRAFTRLLMPLPITDLNSGFKLYRTDLAKRYITVCPDNMAFSDVITLVFLNERFIKIEKGK